MLLTLVMKMERVAGSSETLHILIEGAKAPFQVFVSPDQRLFIGALLSSLLLACFVYFKSNRNSLSLKGLLHYLFPKKLWLHQSAFLDYQLFLLTFTVKALVLVPSFLTKLGLSFVLARTLQSSFDDPWVLSDNRTLIALCYLLTMFVIEDFSRFLLHYAMHRIPWLWRFHQVHHSAEVLTPFTLHRVHPVEVVVASIRSTLSFTLVTGIYFYLFRVNLSSFDIMGVSALGFLFNLAGANLRHSHVTLSFGRAERWFISPRQHQIHHSASPEHFDKNYGTWLSIWDRWIGTLVYSDQISTKPLSFGLGATEQNHQPKLLSSLIAPFQR